MSRFDNTEQRSAEVDDLDLRGVRTSGADDLPTQQAQCRRLSALGFSEHQQMWLIREIECHRLQFKLPYAENHVAAGGIVSNVQRQKFDRLCAAPAPPHDPVLADAWPRDQHFLAVARDAATRRDMAQLPGTLAVHFG